MSPPSPPESSRYSLPALVNDAVYEIFLRIPPDEPASIVRAAAVCKAWRGIVSDPAFRRDYHEFHGAPPMLGFLHNEFYTSTHYLSRFASITGAFCPARVPGRYNWRAVDSRHGRVLYSVRGLVVDDLITGARWKISMPDEIILDPHDEEVEYYEYEIPWNAAILCAKDRCDHRDCHGGPFLVAFVCCNQERGVTFAFVYSSESGKWSDEVSIEQQNVIEEAGHSVLLGDRVYFPCDRSSRIVEYNVGEQKLCMIDVPFHFHVEVDSNLMAAENGMLLFAGVRNSRLYLLSMEAYPSGAVAWAGHRVIELEPLLPHCALMHIPVVGFAQGVGVVFLSTEAGLFTIELDSNRSRKVLGKSSFQKVMPYMSFYTGVHRDDFAQAHGGGRGGRRSGGVSLAAGGATAV